VESIRSLPPTIDTDGWVPIGKRPADKSSNPDAKHLNTNLSGGKGKKVIHQTV